MQKYTRAVDRKPPPLCRQRQQRQPERVPVVGAESLPAHEMLDGRLLISLCQHSRLLVGADSVTLIRAREGRR